MDHGFIFVYELIWAEFQHMLQTLLACPVHIKTKKLMNEYQPQLASFVELAFLVLDKILFWEIVCCVTQC